jgi:hypothetical protein
VNFGNDPPVSRPRSRQGFIRILGVTGIALFLLGLAIVLPLFLSKIDLPQPAGTDGGQVDVTESAGLAPTVTATDDPTTAPEPPDSTEPGPGQPTPTAAPARTKTVTVPAELEECLRVDTHIVCTYRDGRTIALDATEPSGIDLTSALVGVGTMVSASGALLSGVAAWQGHRQRVRTARPPHRASSKSRRR